VRVAALDNISAEFPAGSSTVVLAAPGSGSSTLLRLVSGRVLSTPPSAVTWSGADAAALKVAGVSLARLAAYCREADEHEAHLTVSETLHFAHSTGVVAPTSTHGSVGAHGSDEYTIPSVENVIAAMGLSAASDTIAGGMLSR
jgi:ABC-type multidrug transport system ATPase subunit